MSRLSLDFNHIADLPEEEIEKLRKWYEYYHRLYVCYRWEYKRLRKLKISLQMISVGSVVVGSVLAPFTSLTTISVAGVGVLIQGYLTNSNIISRISQCKFAYTSLEKTLTQIRSYLRGIEYDEIVVISDMKVLEDIIIDICPPIGDKLLNKYDRVYNKL